MLISIAYLLCTDGHKIRKIRSHFPSVSFDLIKISDIFWSRSISTLWLCRTFDAMWHRSGLLPASSQLQHYSGLLWGNLICLLVTKLSLRVFPRHGCSTSEMEIPAAEGKPVHRACKAVVLSDPCLQVSEKESLKKSAHLKDRREESLFSKGRHLFKNWCWKRVMEQKLSLQYLFKKDEKILSAKILLKSRWKWKMCQNWMSFMSLIMFSFCVSASRTKELICYEFYFKVLIHDCSNIYIILKQT